VRGSTSRAAHAGAAKRKTAATGASDSTTATARRALGILRGALPSTAPIELALASDPPSGNVVARVVFGSAGAVGRALWPPTPNALGEAYLRGDVDVEGDLASVARAVKALDLRRVTWSQRLELLRTVFALRRLSGRPRALTRGAALSGRRHSLARDRAAVRFHYDVGTEFYRLWLDERLTYSCAYFDDAHADLDSAQEAKLALICRKLALAPGRSLLDIGCGWGSLIVYAGERYGVRAAGVTLSAKQASHANSEAERRSLAPRVRAEVRDYRELGDLGPFDAIASIGMFEHVGRSALPAYFRAAFAALRPGGLFLNHGIATAMAPARRRFLSRWLETDFVNRHVFPDGELVSLEVALAEARAAGFVMIDLQSLRPHYALTLARWVERLERSREVAVRLVGEEVYRTWRLYMAGARAGFESGELDVAQLLLVRPPAGGPAILPLRPWW